jgi:hypothetical protein
MNDPKTFKIGCVDDHGNPAVFQVLAENKDQAVTYVESWAIRPVTVVSVEEMDLARTESRL